MLKINPRFKPVVRPKQKDLTESQPDDILLPKNTMVEPTVTGQGLDELVSKIKQIRLKKPKEQLMRNKITF